MSHFHEKYNQIEDFLHGRLSGQSLSDFEDMLKHDSDFAMEVKMHQLAEEVVVDYKLNDLRKELKEIALRENNSNWKLYSIGGLIIGGVAIFSYFSYLSDINEVNTKPSSKVTNSSKKTSLIDNNSNQDTLNFERLSHGKEKSYSSKEEIFSDSTNNGIFLANKKLDTTYQLQAPSNNIFNTTVPKEDLNNEKNSTTTNPANNPCENISIQGDFETKGTCKDQESGIIRFERSSIKGGKTPYTFSINEEPYQANPLFTELSAGTYSISIKDKNDCITKHQIKVGEIECKTEHAFNPSLGEVWNIPIIDESELSVKIMDQSGRTVFERTLYIGTPNTWDGSSSNNQELPMGNYSFVINGKNGKTKLGFITIYR